MTTTTSTVQTVTSIGTLSAGASALSAASSIVDFSVNNNLDAKLFVAVTNASTTGVVGIYAAQSLDGTNFEGSSGTLTINQLTYVGSVNIDTSDTNIRDRVFDLAAAFGGTMPKAAKFYAYNGAGATLSSIVLSYAEIKFQTA